MAKIITRIPRYNKSQKLFINNQEITLIDHLKQLRIEKKITKKKISNIIKQNDSWYSQIERDGKKGDDSRQKTIYRPDLINIISIVKYGANSISELGQYHDRSEIYIDKIIKAIPLEESLRALEWYQVNNQRTRKEQDNLFESLIDSITNSLRRTYQHLSDKDTDIYLDQLKEISASLKIDACFLISLAGLPFSEFLYEADQNRIDNLMNDILHSIEEFEIKHKDDDNRFSNKDLFDKISHDIKQYINIAKYTRRNTFQFIDESNYTNE